MANGQPIVATVMLTCQHCPGTLLGSSHLLLDNFVPLLCMPGTSCNCSAIRPHLHQQNISRSSTQTRCHRKTV